MAAWQRVTTVLGGAVLVAMLLLSSPGVRVVRADGPVSEVAPADGPVCEASQPMEAGAELQAFFARLRAGQQAQAAEGPQEGVALNNRGYNYGPPPGVDTDLVRIDARNPGR